VSRMGAHLRIVHHIQRSLLLLQCREIMCWTLPRRCVRFSIAVHRRGSRGSLLFLKRSTHFDDAVPAPGLWDSGCVCRCCSSDLKSGFCGSWSWKNQEKPIFFGHSASGIGISIWFNHLFRRNLVVWSSLTRLLPQKGQVAVARTADSNAWTDGDSGSSVYYRGLQTKTRSGKTCQKWQRKVHTSTIGLLKITPV
jgi:hypothetical protein